MDSDAFTKLKMDGIIKRHRSSLHFILSEIESIRYDRVYRLF